ncbi:hydrolase [Peribacillus saganii]|uniref:Hydrolase n=1 Tax=Peribacillus saganii TaxID=2303992 RepID=A0A372LLV3_9BACI|nr:alpha/beta fold hydrolase [Peribacillus saganii]RFU68037.1 hydrolase [Peribacillus saganii]
MERTFQMDGQWNIIYYPSQPSGFSVIVLGDRTHYVDSSGAFWSRHPGRLQIVQHLKRKGYTLFSSNLYGANWGSSKAAYLAQCLYHFIMRNEIVNEKIHILAEGMGALTALKLIELLPGSIRSAVFINPILSLKASMEKEKHNRVFYKKWIEEASSAHGLKIREMEEKIHHSNWIEWRGNVPLKIIHIFGGGETAPVQLYKIMEQRSLKRGTVFEMQYLMPEKRYKTAEEASRFFKKFENSL